MHVTIYHNPRCSKSRQTLALLQEHGIEPEIIDYLRNPPAAATLSRILNQLGMSAAELMRTGEDEYQAAKEQIVTMSNTAQIAWLIANPKVIERPIVVTPKGTRIGRPPENVLTII